MAAVPLRQPGLAHCTVEPIADGMRVKAAIDLPEAAGEVALFELRSTPMWVSDSEAERQGNTLLLSAEFVPDSGKPLPPRSVRSAHRRAGRRTGNQHPLVHRQRAFGPMMQVKP